MVDNRYTGVGYEPPFETPSDKDFMAAHIEELESRVRGLEAERDRLKEESEKFIMAVGLASTTVPSMEIDVEDPIGMMQKVCDEFDKLRARHAALVDVIVRLENEWDADWPMPYCLVEFLESSEIANLKAALAEVKG